jgi:hypothetical protein
LGTATRLNKQQRRQAKSIVPACSADLVVTPAGAVTRAGREAAQEIVTAVTESYAAWVESHPDLGHEMAQSVVFAKTAQRLARGGLPLSSLLRIVLRAYGLRGDSIQINDSVSGESLMQFDTATH